MNQFLMIFNMEENHIWIKQLKKTALPIVNIEKRDWLKYNLKEESSGSSGFKTFAYIILFFVIAAIIFYIYCFIRRKDVNSSKIEMNAGNNKDVVY